MDKQLAVVVIHGMGDTGEDFVDPLRERIEKRLDDEQAARVHWQSVYYQPVLQPNQRRLMRDTLRQADIDWIRLRRFVLYGFSDAAAMEARPQMPGSVYEQIQRVIVEAMEAALVALGDPTRPVILVAHSLGCQVISNYIWDAQQSRPGAGIFSPASGVSIPGTTREGKFLRLKTLRFLLTSGCNIPIFIAGLPQEKIEPVLTASRGWDFRWENYYDPDDVLGWPLRPLSPSYRRAVGVEKSISAGTFFNAWSPLAHNNYWKDADFLKPLAARIKALAGN